MARVNHKLLMQRLNEKRSQITDQQFFTSRLLAGHFEEMAAVQTRRYRYDRRVSVYLYWDSDDPRSAWTNDRRITINVGHPYITEINGRLNRYRNVCGVFAHELGHVLYTDFLYMQKYVNDFCLLKWFPVKPRCRNAKERDAANEIWEYAQEDELNLKALLSVAKDIQNIIEDGYIEIRMLNDYPGRLGQCLNARRAVRWEKTPTVTQLKEAEAEKNMPIFGSIRDIMLAYLRFGEIKYGDELLNDERIQTVFKLIPVFDEALLSANSKDRFNAVNLVLIRCWEYIKEYCEQCKEQFNEQQANGEDGEIEKIVAGVLNSMSGGSEIGTGNSKPVISSSAVKESSKTAAKRAATRRLAGQENETEEEDDEEEVETDSMSGENENLEDEKTEEKTPEGDATDSEELPEDGLDREGISGDRQNVTSEEQGRIPEHYTERVSEPEGGSVQTDTEYEEDPYDHAADDIERVLETMAKQQASEELESERLQELNDMARSISYGDVHKGVNIYVNRVAAVNENHIEQYDRIAKPLIGISKQLQRGILQRLQESRRSEKLSGLVSGRRLSSHSLYRQDGKMFYKNRLPNETELAVGLVIDESGSMCGRDRCTYARATSIILEDFCRNLDIPVMIYGHSTSWRSGNTVELYSYVEFDGFDNDDKYRLMNVSSRSGNRDGAALRFVAERLMQRPEDQKLLMIISDGQPADDGYSGTAAEEDLRGIKQEYQRKGVLFVAAAIGDDKQNIERIYGDSFLDITDLTQLPVKLTNVIKRYIRV